MGIFDFFIGGNAKVAAKSTMDIFNDGISTYSDPQSAYRYTYIFRSNTIAKYLKYERDVYVANLFRHGNILNCTRITVANLNTGAAPRNIYFEQTYNDFHRTISEHLRKFDMPEEFITGDNKKLVVNILEYLEKNEIVPPAMYDSLVLT